MADWQSLIQNVCQNTHRMLKWGVMSNKKNIPSDSAETTNAAMPFSSPPTCFKDIFEAARNGTVRDVEHFVKNHVDINAKDREGWTALHMAARYNSNVDVLKYRNYSAVCVVFGRFGIFFVVKYCRRASTTMSVP